MEIVIHGHQAELTESLKTRAEDGVRKLNDHLRQLVSADVCFAGEGVQKSVEVVVHAPGNSRLVSKAESKYHEAALTEAIQKMDAQIRKLKSVKKAQVHDTELRA